MGLDGCGKSRTIGLRSPDFPSRSEYLYRLSYHGAAGLHPLPLLCAPLKSITGMESFNASSVFRVRHYVVI